MVSRVIICPWNSSTLKSTMSKVQPLGAGLTFRQKTITEVEHYHLQKTNQATHLPQFRLISNLQNPCFQVLYCHSHVSAEPDHLERPPRFCMRHMPPAQPFIISFQFTTTNSDIFWKVPVLVLKKHWAYHACSLHLFGKIISQALVPSK